ncbi:MAG: 6-carboxyhexanoate--CoA ligase [Persephonella sp.]|nr:MAG: 6-carboxyhexanoate--CoA ligase [Persephonella sp.]RUM61336.1 MAG: 6-carboxyhexanoate--CoA ligase [Persephonella sp.]
MLDFSKLFSIKARSSKEGLHISGAERIVEENKIDETVLKILKKVRRNEADFISIKIEKLKLKPIVVEKTLCIEDIKFNDYKEANRYVLNILKDITGIDKRDLKHLIDLIHNGASPNGENMRGAMIVNQKGERIELNKYRGIRTRNIDFIGRENILKKLQKLGYTERTLDALAISTKNLLNENIIAEYCISDEDNYTTGYLAIKNKYLRITPLKRMGNKFGGRIYFVKNETDIYKLYDYLENCPILIKDVCV